MFARSDSSAGIRSRATLTSFGILLLAALARAQEPAPPPPPPESPPAEPPPPAEAAPPPAEDVAAPEGVAPSDPGPAAAVGEPAPVQGEIGEVVVTVDRRKKNLQDYSGTASAFSEEQLSTVGVRNLRDIDTKVPGMQIANQEGNTEVYIRGVGSDNNTELGDPAVAVHLDGVYLPRPRGMGAMFYDIARVEVNSGPQGTLRGRNALGGTVNIIANQPVFGEYQANAEATFGTFSQRRYQGMINIPIGSTLALRAAGFSEVHDPHWQNGGPIYDIKGPESIDSYSYRTTLAWQPVKEVRATAAFDYTRERGTGWLGANFQNVLTRTDDNGTPDDPSDDFPDPIAPEDIENPRRIYRRGMQSGVDLKHYGVRGELLLDLGPVQVEMLGSYRNMRFLQNNGSNAGLVYPGYQADELTPDNYSAEYWNQGSESVVAEVRAFAPDTERLRWTVGAFFFDETQDTNFAQAGDQSQGFGGSEFPMPKTEGGSIAGYADATFDVAQPFRLLGGVRVTHETKSRKGGLWSLYTGWPGGGDERVRFGTEGFRFNGVNRSQFRLPDNATVTDRVNFFLDGIESFGARDTIPQYLCQDPPEPEPGQPPTQRLELVDGHFRCAYGIHPDLLAAEQAGGTPFGITAVPQNNEVSATFVDWRGGVEYDLAERSLLYFTVSSGHKAGGFNDTAAINGLFDSEYDPESVVAFELGSKNEFLDRHLRLNASAFYYRYHDQVFQTIISVTPPDPVTMMGGSNTAVRDNAASSNIYGLDLDLVAALPAGFELGLHALLMSAKYGEGVTVHDARLGFDIGQYPVDIGGHWLPRVSPLTMSYSLSQVIFTDAGVFDWIVSGYTNTKHYMTVFNGEGNLLPAVDGRIPDTDSYRAVEANPARLTDVINGYTRFDLGANWKHPDSRISLGGFVNNVFNTTYATSIISTPGLNLRFFNPPRTAGVRFRVDW
jgi:iron complex outermembrane recepter protein